MDLLVVAPYVPFSGIRHAGGAFLLEHLARLAGTGTVTLLAPQSPDNEHALALAPSWLTVVLAPVDEPVPGTPQHRRDHWEHRLRGWSPAPFELRALLRSGLVFRARAADLVELHWPEYAHLATVLRAAGVDTPLVVVDHDVASQAELRRLRAKPSVLKRAFGYALRPGHLHNERVALDAADLVLVFKDADAQLLADMGVRTPVRVIDPWLDPPSGAPRRTRPGTVLFTGALWRAENKAAALWLLRAVWPQVRAAAPGAVLRLVGARPGGTLTELAEATPGVQLVGEVPDLEPSYLSAAVFAAPLHVGGGLKFKVPQAMLHGLPVVATHVAAEGVVEDAPAGTFWAVTDDADEYADALVRALEQPEAAADCGARAAAWCAAHFSFARSGRELRADYERLVATGRRRSSRPRAVRSSRDERAPDDSTAADEPGAGADLLVRSLRSEAPVG